MMSDNKKQATKKLRREAIRIQNTSTTKLSMSQALKEAQHRRNNPNA
jgi:hypothetical protein